jgi:hypothetical protein
MASLSEIEAQQAYRGYQAAALTENRKIMTFLEWVLETKTVLRDVPPEQFAELLT